MSHTDIRLMDSYVTPQWKEVPPDGGWGWMIVLGNTVYMILVQLSAVFSIIFSPLLLELGSSFTTVSWLVTIYNLMYNLTGLLVGPLTNQYGWRAVGVTGSFLVFTSFVISAFANSALYLMFSFSILSGIGSGLGGNMAFLVIASYFNHRRGLANAILMGGISCGQFIGPPLISYLLEQLSYKGTSLVYAAITLNGCVMALLFHPVGWHMKKISVPTEEVDDKENQDAKSLKKVKHSFASFRDVADSLVSSHEYIPSDTKLKGSNQKDINKIETNFTNTIPDEIIIDNRYAAINLSKSIAQRNLGKSLRDRCSSESQHRDSFSIEDTCLTRTMSDATPDDIKRSGRTWQHQVLQLREESEGSQIFFYSRSSIARLSLDDVSTYSMSYLDKYEDQTKENVDALSKTTIEVPCGSFGRVLKSTFLNLKILSSFRALVIVIASVLFRSGFLNFGMMVPFALQSTGYSLDSAAWAVSTGSIVNFCARLIVSVLSDQDWFNMRLFFIGGFFLTALSMIVFSFLDGLILIYICMGIYGCGIGTCMSLYNLVQIEYMGIDNLAAMVAANCLLNAFGGIIIGPLVGVLRDVSNSFSISMFFLGGLVAGSLLLWVLMPVAQKLDGRSNKLLKDTSENAA
ncbi:unnamed protein product, partial [Meganyctiphanes norvegica]